MLIALVCSCWLVGLGQDIHFTQFTEAPLNLNPANAGYLDGDWRVTNNYRRQWAALGEPFVTATIGFDLPVEVRGSKLGIGGWILNDRSGMLNLNIFQANLAAALFKKAGNNHFRIGAQAGYVSKSFSTANLTFPDQFEWEAGVFNGALTTSATGFNQQTNYLDVSAGLGWSRKMRGWTPDISVGFQHLNAPNDAFFSTTHTLPVRTTVAGAAIIDLNATWYLWPRVLHLQHTSASQTAASGIVGYRLEPNKANALIFVHLGQKLLKRIEITDLCIAV